MIGDLLDRLRERTGVDIDWVERRIHETLRGYVHLNETAVPRGLASARSPLLALWTARTRLFETNHHDRLVVTRIRALPLLDGLALSARPRDTTHPWLIADYFCFPTRVTANAWLFGPPFPTRSRDLDETIGKLARLPPPAWISGLTNGEGFSVRATPAAAEEVFGALRTMITATLARLNHHADTPRGEPPRPLATRIRDAAPFARRLRRIFGWRFARRYGELLFGFNRR